MVLTILVSMKKLLIAMKKREQREEMSGSARLLGKFASFFPQNEE